MPNDYPFSPYPNPNPQEGAAQQFSQPEPVSFSEPLSEPIVEEDVMNEKKALAVVVLVFVVLALIVGGLLYYLFRDTEDETPSEAPQEKAEQEKNLINAEKGGVVSFEDGASIEIPANALSEDTRIFIERISAGEVTDLYRLKPDGLKFLKPVTLSIPYHQLPQDMRLNYWFTEGGLKKPLRYSVLEEKKMLRTAVREF